MLYLTDSTGSRTELNITIPINDSIPFEKYKLVAADSTFKDVENLFNEKEFSEVMINRIEVLKKWSIENDYFDKTKLDKYKKKKESE